MSMHSLYYEREADERDRTAREVDLAMEAYQMAADNEREMEDQAPEFDPLVQAIYEKRFVASKLQEDFDYGENQRPSWEQNCDNPQCCEYSYLVIYGAYFYPQAFRLGCVFYLDWH